jgi:putative transposase
VHYRTVFEQLLNYIPRHEFQSSVRRHESDRNSRRLSTWTWFGALLFGQLTGRDSLRSLERPFSLAVGRLRSSGMQPVRRSTLADANHSRPLAVLEETYARLLKAAERLVPAHRLQVPGGSVLLMDATIIDLYRRLNPWAEFRRGTSAAKLHTAISLDGELPAFFVVTPALSHDCPIARRCFRFPKGSTVVFDRGYWNARWLGQLTEQEVAFVTRARRNNTFRVTERHPADRSAGILCDQTVRQIPGRIGSRVRGRRYHCYYPGDLRRISFLDPGTKKRLVFLTNRFDLDAATICALYKARWQVELFFKALKQNLKIGRFLGRSRRAVEAQILVALIAYVLLQIARLASRTELSTTVAMQTLRALALYRQPLEQILGPPRPESAPKEGLARAIRAK